MGRVCVFFTIVTPLFGGCAPDNGTNSAQNVDAIPVPPEVNTERVDPAIVVAVTSARQKVIASPREAKTWGHYGMTLLAHDFTVAAAICFSEAGRLDTTEPKWLYLHARCVSKTDPDLAKSLLEQCVGLDRVHVETPRSYLIELLLEENMLDTAESHLLAVAKRNSSNIRARHAKARLYFMREEYQSCKHEILDLLDGIKRQYDVRKSRVAGLLDEGQKRLAREELRRANQDLQQSLCKQKTLGLLLAAALRQLGEVKNAEKQGQMAMTNADNTWPDPYVEEVFELRTGLRDMLSKADIAYGQKRYAQSTEILEKTVANYPDSLFGHILLGRCYIRLGRIAHDESDVKIARQRLNQAGDRLRRALSIDQNSVEAQFRLAVSLEYLAELDGGRELLAESETWYRKAVSLKPDFTMAYYNLAVCVQKQGRVDDAIEALRSAVRLEPNHVRAREMLGGLLMRKGDLSEAEENLRLVIQLNPNSPRARQLLDQVLKKKES